MNTGRERGENAHHEFFRLAAVALRCFRCAVVFSCSGCFRCFCFFLTDLGFSLPVILLEYMNSLAESDMPVDCGLPIHAHGSGFLGSLEITCDGTIAGQIWGAGAALLKSFCMMAFWTDQK